MPLNPPQARNSREAASFNHALPLTAPGVTVAASGRRLAPAMQLPRRPPQSLSLGSSLGVATRTMKTAFFFITFLAAGFAALAANKPGFSEFFPGGVFSRNDDGNDAFISGWYASQLRAFKEPSLCTSPQKQGETYRFTMLPTFNFPLTVRIHIESDGTATAIAKRLTGKGGYDPGKLDFERTQTLTRKQVVALRTAIADNKFWQMATALERPGCDGTEWIFEAVRDGRYHIVTRWSPSDKNSYRQLCDRVLRLGGLDEIDAYLRERPKPK